MKRSKLSVVTPRKHENEDMDGTAMDIPFNCDLKKYSTEVLIERQKKMKLELKRADSLLIDREMLKVDKDPDTWFNRPCGGDRCTTCNYIYTNPRIYNRYTSELHQLTSHGCNGFVEGVYGIFCVKRDCPIKGLVYVGESHLVVSRIRQHMASITQACTPIHGSLPSHFNADHEGTDNPLKYFRFVLLEEVKGGIEKRKEKESFYMDLFKTRGFFGLNINKNKPEPEHQSETLPTPEPSTSRKVPYTLIPHSAPVERPRLVNDFVLTALVLKNHTTERQNPDRHQEFATISEIGIFIRHYFIQEKLNVLLRSLLNKIRNNAAGTIRNPNLSIENSDQVSDWFVGRKEANELVVGLNSGVEEEIKTGIDIEKTNLHKIMKVPSQVGALLAGKLPLPQLITFNENILVALALQNFKAVRTDPLRNSEEILRNELLHFIDQYFNEKKLDLQPIALWKRHTKNDSKSPWFEFGKLVHKNRTHVILKFNQNFKEEINAEIQNEEDFIADLMKDSNQVDSMINGTLTTHLDNTLPPGQPPRI